MCSRCWGAERAVQLQVLPSDPGVLMIEIQVTAPAHLAGDAPWPLATHVAEGLPVLHLPGLPDLPFLCLTLVQVATSPAVELVLSVSDTLPLRGDAHAEAGELSFAEGETYVEEETFPPPGVCPRTAYELQPVGRFRDRALLSLRVFPFRSVPPGLLIVHRRVVLRATGVELLDGWRGLRQDNRRPQGLPQAASAAHESAADHFGSIHPRVRIIVEEDGFYRVEAAQLAKAGIDPAAIDPGQLRLTHRGRQVPFYLAGDRDGRFDPVDYLEFWGQANRQTWQALAPDMYRDPYSDENTYWLSWEGPPGVRLTDEQVVFSGAELTSPRIARSFWETVHIEEDNAFNRLSQLPGDSLRDHWFYDTGVQGGMLREYRFHLSWPDPEAPEAAELRVMLNGLSFVPGVLHSVSLFVNGVKAAEGQWSEQDRKEVRTAPGGGIPPERLLQGENVLTLVNQVPPEQVDLVALNWFELSYARRYRAEQDIIEFGLPREASPGVHEFRIDGFSVPDVDVYKLGMSKLIGARVEPVYDEEEGWSYEVCFQDEVFSADARYVAVAGHAKKAPLRLEVAQPTWLRSPYNGADYVAIVPDTFAEDPSLQALVAHRQSEGLRVSLAPLQAIYDEFNFGIPSAYALKDFLRYAWHHWQPPALSYVLLVGDGSWDYKDRHRRGGNLVPVFMRQTTKWGAAASDHWYALMDEEDEVPDLFIGRLPVRNAQELSAVVNKILTFERTSPMDAWRNRLLLIGGTGSVFRQQSEAILTALIPPSFAVERLYTDAGARTGPFYGGTDQLVAHWTQGLAYINFLGHGGGAVWSDNSLLRLEDVSRLPSSIRYPIISSMTCFTASFEDPFRRSLGEELVVAPNKGAVAVFGASGVGWLYNDYYLVREFIDALLQAESDTRLGEVVAEAKTRYLSAYPGSLNYSMVSQYNLLGDPALRMPFPRQSCSLRLSSRLVQPGDSLTVEGQWQNTTGMAAVELTDGQRVTSAAGLSVVRNRAFRHVLGVPADFAGAGHVRAYVYHEDSRQAANGAISVAAAPVHIDSVWTHPAKPGPEDSVTVLARVFPGENLALVICVVQTPVPDTICMVASSAELGVFSSERHIPPYGRGTVVRFVVSARDQLQNERTRSSSYAISLGPELFIDPSGVRLGGTSMTQVEAPVWNSGDVECRGVRVDAFLVDSLSANLRHLGTCTVDIAPLQKTIAAIPGFVGSGHAHLKLIVDGDNQFAEANEDNNTVVVRLPVDRFVITRQLGTSTWGTSSDTLLFRDCFRMFVRPESAPGAMAVTIRSLDTVHVYGQPDVRPVRRAQKACAYEVSSAIGDLSVPAVVGVRCGASSQSQAGSLYSFSRLTRKWEQVPTHREDGWLVAEGVIPGRFAVMESDDVLPPTIETLVDGQRHVAESYVSPQPLVTFILQDANGVALNPQSLSIALDGQPVPWSMLLLPDSLADGAQVSVSFRPQLAQGSHICQVQARDCCGNVSGPLELMLTVASSFDLRLLGTYPNPFVRQTVFVYELSRWADDLSLSIYTTSGHLVRRIKATEAAAGQNPLAPGYHEIPWDGTDDQGDEVPNGIYFYKLCCTDGERTIEQTGTIARIR